MGLEAPFYFFLIDLDMLECRGLRSECDQVPNSSFCCPRSSLEREAAHSSMAATLLKLVFLPLLISNATQAMVLHLFVFTFPLLFYSLLTLKYKYK